MVYCRSLPRLYVRLWADMFMTTRQCATLRYNGSPASFFFFLLRLRFLRGWLSVSSGATGGGPVRLRTGGEGRIPFLADIALVGDS